MYYAQDQRQHHCILKRVSRDDKDSDTEFEYKKRKQELFVQELLRVGIKTTFVNEYHEITEILKAAETRFKHRTVFISGAAHEFSSWKAEEAQKFVHDLSIDIGKMSYRVVSGFGLGVGSAVITGVLEHIYMSGGRLDSDQLVLRPFPQSQSGAVPLRALWTDYRKDMIQRAGIAIFLFGNKLVDGKIELSGGMREEYEIAKELGAFLLPVGATGYIAQELWNEVVGNFDAKLYRNGVEIAKRLNFIGNPKLGFADLRKNITEIISLL